MAAVDPKGTLSDEALAASLAIDARAPASRRRLVGVRLRIAALESAVSVRRGEAGDAARRASPLLPVVQGVARHDANSPGSCSASSRAARVAASCIGCRREDVKAELALLWRREMVTGAYRPRWVSVRAGTRTLTALAFIIDRAHSHYTGRLTLDAAGEGVGARRRRLRLVSGLSRARAHRADHARHRRSLPGSARGQGRRASALSVGILLPASCTRSVARDACECRQPVD